MISYLQFSLFSLKRAKIYIMAFYNSKYPTKSNYLKFLSTKVRNIQRHHVSQRTRIGILALGLSPHIISILQYMHNILKYLVMRNTIQTHEKEKPYKCDICEYSCPKKYILSKHMEVSSVFRIQSPGIEYSVVFSIVY